MNTPRVVMQETKKAFRAIDKRKDLEGAVNALSNLKGVGPAMASGNHQRPSSKCSKKREDWQSLYFWLFPSLFCHRVGFTTTTTSSTFDYQWLRRFFFRAVFYSFFFSFPATFDSFCDHGILLFAAGQVLPTADQPCPHQHPQGGADWVKEGLQEAS